MNAISRLPQATPVIPENAPFSPEQRAWLNGFFAGLLSSGGQDATALTTRESAGLAAAPGQETAPQELEDDGAPWHDQTLPSRERMKLAEGRPLPRRMMAAMAQQDCGQCGYNCQDYANAIALQAEDRLNLCVPGAKETARMLKTLVEEMGGGATDPDEAKAKAEAKAAAKALDADTRPGRSREHPGRGRVSRRAKGSTAKGRKRRPITSSSISRTPASIMNRAIVSASFPLTAKVSPGKSSRQSARHRIFPLPERPCAQVLCEDVSLGLAPDMLFELISYITGGASRAKAKALARGEDPDGDAATLDVLAAIAKIPKTAARSGGLHRGPRPAATTTLFDRVLVQGGTGSRRAHRRSCALCDRRTRTVWRRLDLRSARSCGPATRSRPISSARMISPCPPMTRRQSS